jgi:hypothetical protein
MVAPFSGGCACGAVRYHMNPDLPKFPKEPMMGT